MQYSDNDVKAFFGHRCRVFVSYEYSFSKN